MKKYFAITKELNNLDEQPIKIEEIPITEEEITTIMDEENESYDEAINIILDDYREEYRCYFISHLILSENDFLNLKKLM
jgi:hypothetical protein